MPYTEAGKEVMLDALARGTAPGSSISHTGAQSADASKALTTPFGTASTDIFTATAHGFAAGDLVLFSGLTGGAGLVAGRPYFVIATNLTANAFSVSRKSGGTIEDFTTDITVGTVQRLVEISGGSPAYARKAIVYAVAALGISDDSTNGAVIDIPAGAHVDYVSMHSAVSAGTLLAVQIVTTENFAAQGTYTVTDAKLDLNSVG